ncbi:MAG: hypothetical protein ACR2QJ_06975 [Geminicoccaceae bacterium]
MRQRQKEGDVLAPVTGRVVAVQAFGGAVVINRFFIVGMLREDDRQIAALAGQTLRGCVSRSIRKIWTSTRSKRKRPMTRSKPC